MFGQSTGQKGFGLATTSAATSGFSFGAAAPTTTSTSSQLSSSLIGQSAGFQLTGIGAPTSSSTSALGGVTFGAVPFSSQPASLGGVVQLQGTGATKLGLTPSSQPTAAVTTTSNSQGATSFNFGVSAADKKTTQGTVGLIKTSNAPAATTTVSSIGFGSLTAKPATSLQVSSQSVPSTKGASIIAPSTSSAVATASEKSLTYKQLEDIINKWVHELEEQENVFINQAKQVNTWDRLLIQNGEKITVLNSEIERLKTEQSSLDRELDFVLSKQQELEEILTPLENQMKEQQTIPYMQHADIEREKTYQMAEGIDSQLKRMMQDLKDIIGHINNSNINLNENEDPMSQIAKILNSHMDSLQWVDQNSMILQKKVEDVSKYVENKRREHERSLRLTFD